jgi:hypothetical protein
MDTLTKKWWEIRRAKIMKAKKARTETAAAAAASSGVDGSATRTIVAPEMVLLRDVAAEQVLYNCTGVTWYTYAGCVSAARRFSTHKISGTVNFIFFYF